MSCHPPLGTAIVLLNRNGAPRRELQARVQVSACHMDFSAFLLVLSRLPTMYLASLAEGSFGNEGMPECQEWGVRGLEGGLSACLAASAWLQRNALRLSCHFDLRAQSGLHHVCHDHQLLCLHW